MATQLFADEELERLRGFPDIGREELFRFFTLMPADLAFVDPGRGRGPADRLGLAVSLCTLPWLGFVPDKVTAAPPVAVARLASQLNIDPDELRAYGRRVKTRQDHVCLVARRRTRPTRTNRLPAPANPGHLVLTRCGSGGCRPAGSTGYDRVAFRSTRSAPASYRRIGDRKGIVLRTDLATSQR